jgi:hypothetical protein
VAAGGGRRVSHRADGVEPAGGGAVPRRFGIDLRVLEFHLWGPRRGRLSFTGDVASQYRNLAFAIGFWH